MGVCTHLLPSFLLDLIRFSRSSPRAHNNLVSCARSQAHLGFSVVRTCTSIPTTFIRIDTCSLSQSLSTQQLSIEPINNSLALLNIPPPSTGQERYWTHHTHAAPESALASTVKGTITPSTTPMTSTPTSTVLGHPRLLSLCFHELHFVV